MANKINPKVLVMVITQDYVMRECWESILNQDYPNFEASIYMRKRPNLSFEGFGIDEKTKRGYDEKFKHIQVSNNWSLIRKIGLATDADIFQLVDSDVVIPKNTLTEQVKQMNATHTTIAYRNPSNPLEIIPAGQPLPRKHIMGGWYRMRNHPSFYVAGIFVADNTFMTFDEVQPSLIETHMIGLGCLTVTREILEKVDFRPGYDRMLKSAYRPQDGFIFANGTDLAFGDDCDALGYRMYMNGDIVCKHLERKEYEQADRAALLG